MDFLQKIIEEKKVFIQKQKKNHTEDEIIAKMEIVRRPRFKTILEKPGTHLIAEIKRASPSKGDLRPDLNIIDIASTYQSEGIELVSVLTEEKFFKGSLNDLTQVKKNTDLSILCKDFILDSFQIREAKIHGADAILLIARILSKEQLKELLGSAKSLHLDAVVEIHDETDLEKIQALINDIEIIGINHRNLDDFSIDLSVSNKLLPKIPKGKIVIAESGIGSAIEIRQFKKIGVNGILIGESLMVQSDLTGKIREFKDALK